MIAVNTKDLKWIMARYSHGERIGFYYGSYYFEGLLDYVDLVRREIVLQQGDIYWNQYRNSGFTTKFRFNASHIHGIIMREKDADGGFIYYGTKKRGRVWSLVCI